MGEKGSHTAARLGQRRRARACRSSRKRALCRETPSLVKVFKNFKETAAIKLPFAAEGIHGGPMLAVRGKDFVCFYDWATCHVRAAALCAVALCAAAAVPVAGRWGWGTNDQCA